MTLNNSEKKSNNGPIMELAPNDYDEESPLLHSQNQPNHSILSTPNVDTIRVPSISRYRITNILRTLFFIEFLTLIIIWFTGNNIFFIFYPI